MSEYLHVEKPFLDQLAALGWDITDQEFWNEIDKVMPDYQERKAWLRENGASLDV